MRALRDKLWAKLTALVLFVLLGFLALLRTAQLFSNYMPGDEVGGSVLFIAVCAAGCLVCLIFSLSSAGHWAEHEGIYLTWLDRIPLDVLFLVPLCMWMEASWATVGLYWLSSIVYWAALLCVTALFAVSFAARCKAGDLWRNTLIWRTVRVTGRAARSLWRGMRQLVRGLPLVWRTALVLGAVLIAVGANLLVDNGTLIAQALGVPESVIALTFVALGTSLPELVTAVTSLVKGHSDLSLGNIVGANVFNLVLVSGMSITLAPFTIPQSATLFGINSSLVLDLPVMLAVMLIQTVPALVKGKLNRAQGILLLAIYAAFCAVQFAM